MEELFPDFDWANVAELKRTASLRGGLKKLSVDEDGEAAKNE
jgi:hypothetical protein